MTTPSLLSRRTFLFGMGVATVAVATGIAVAAPRHSETGTTLAAASHGSAATPTASTTTTQPAATDRDLLAAIARCQHTDCRVLERVDHLDSPTGPATLVAVHVPDNDRFGADNDYFLYLVAAGKVLWTPATDASFFDGTLDGQPRFVRDASGNILMPVLTGVHDGAVIALRVTPERINDFGSAVIDAARDAWAVSFTQHVNPFLGNATARLVAGPVAGQYDIAVQNSDYSPDFAEGTITTTTLRWDGSRYRPVSRSQR